MMPVPVKRGCIDPVWRMYFFFLLSFLFLLLLLPEGSISAVPRIMCRLAWRHRHLAVNRPLDFMRSADYVQFTQI